jgi:hypothetical protein
MPRISVNKLGQYVVCSSPARRRRIIQDQKNPSKAIVPLYRLAEAPIAEFLAGGGQDEALIARAVSELRSPSSASTWTRTDRQNTAEALERLMVASRKLPLKGVTYTRGPDHPRPLRVKGVDISVAPNFLLFFQQRGVDCVGALKIHYPKSEDSALERDGGEYVATVLMKWLDDFGPAGRKVMPSHCLSLDVFRAAVVSAPTATTRRMANVVAACEEILAHWDRL